MNDRSQGWFSIIRMLLLALLPLAILVGWGIDRSTQLQALKPNKGTLAELRKQVDWLQERVEQRESFDGFDSVEEVMDVIANTYPDEIYGLQAALLTEASDEVFREAVPRVIALLGDEELQNRERAWVMLSQTSFRNDRQEFLPAYHAGLAELVRLPSIDRFEDVLTRLRKNDDRTEPIKQALIEKMNRDDDRYAPFAAYTLAELYPDFDIAPRLVEMVEREHSQSLSILFNLPKYMPAEEALPIQGKYWP
ncbi:hypothetical protein [Blastopirellula marina]|uniref:HEAT repeat domain-containing protein n=1 Tax=Blastopirellula marina TaxID=124 RepID=A0A2S8GKC6_9BACT|nr:hypothetical protein [Blastopirellula marina]PQO44840.1 hypothetical protein C5Y93_17250 [Blastopirellula marina]